MKKQISILLSNNKKKIIRKLITLTREAVVNGSLFARRRSYVDKKLQNFSHYGFILMSKLHTDAPFLYGEPHANTEIYKGDIEEYLQAVEEFVKKS